MAPDRRLHPLWPWQEARERALDRWRAARDAERLAWTTQGPVAEGMDEVDVDWLELWQAERALEEALRSGAAWPEVIPADHQGRGVFYQAVEMLGEIGRRRLADLARRTLDATPHQEWLAPSREQATTREFDRAVDLTAADHFDLWLRLGPVHLDLGRNVAVALAVLRRTDVGALADLLATLPPLLLHAVGAREDNPDLFLALATSSEATAASYGAWRYRDYLTSLERYGDGPVRNLNMFRSPRHEVGVTTRSAQNRTLGPDPAGGPTAIPAGSVSIKEILSARLDERVFAFRPRSPGNSHKGPERDLARRSPKKSPASS